VEPAMTTDRLGVVADALPGEIAWPRLRRRLILLCAVIAAVAAVVVLLPGLGSVRRAFGGARPEWLLFAGVLEVLSCLSYVLVFRGGFCARMSWRTSYEIGVAELATNSLVNVGGAGGLALGAWILRRGGMPAGRVARRTVAFFLITSLANVGALIVAAVGLGTGVLHGAPSSALGWTPAAVGAVAVAGVLALPFGARAIAARIGRPSVTPALEAVAGGVDEAACCARATPPCSRARPATCCSTSRCSGSRSRRSASRRRRPACC
jgi:hypothetical protein